MRMATIEAREGLPEEAGAALAGVAGPPASDVFGSMVDGYRLATAALADMQRHRVFPTARAYELWLVHQMNGKPGLSARIAELTRAGAAVTPAVVDQLREEYGIDGLRPDEESEADALAGMSDGLHEAAQLLIAAAANGRSVIREFGAALAHGVTQLAARPERDDSMRVISALTTETLAAAGRTRELESQLAATSARVDKLQKLLLDERRASSTDSLTGLANRREFDARIKRTLHKVSSDPSVEASLLLLDIDHFKHFNDSHGHRAGDLVLRLVGRLLIDSIKGRDLAARYGGEEFAIVLIGADLNAAAKVARQIGSTLANKRIKFSSGSEEGHGRVTISIGVAQMRLEDSTGSLIDRADAALYAAKHAGRNRVTTERELSGALAEHPRAPGGQ